MQICFAGGGKMAEALIGGLISTQWASPSDIGVVEISSDRRDHLEGRFDALRTAASVDAALADGFDLTDLVLAVKPQHVGDVAVAVLGDEGSAGQGREAHVQRVLSIAAGVTIESLEAAFGPSTRVVRAMPNTPALVGAGASAIAGSARTTADDLTWATDVLSKVGTVAAVEESLLDAVTGVSGSGPAYLFMLAEAMTAAGVDQGLTLELADQLTRQTLLGAATLLANSADEASQLRANVTSPGGTTAAAIKVMVDRDLDGVVRSAIDAATTRSRELGAD